MSREWVFSYTHEVPPAGTVSVEAETEEEALALACEQLNDSFVNRSGLSLMEPMQVTLELSPTEVDIILSTRLLRERAERESDFEAYDELVEGLGRDLFMQVRDLLDGGQTLYGPTE